MFYIAETEQQLQFLSSFKEGYVEYISTHDEYHPKLTSLVAVYIHPLNHPKGYILPLNHQEGINLTIERVSEVLSSYEHLYTINKKEGLWLGEIKNLIDISLLYSMTYYKKLEVEVKHNTYTQFYSRFREFDNVNQIIPLSKLHEYAEERFLQVEKYIKLEVPSGFEFYNSIATGVFYLIEQSGIKITKSFVEMFKPKDPSYSIKGGKIYSLYNLYNITSRPTNVFNSVNFTAIPKGEDFRKCFIPRNDYLVEFDFDGYHLRILGEEIGYRFGEDSAHKHLARLMFGKEEISDEEYSHAKQVNFQAIYGNIPREYENLEFFKKLKAFVQKLWETYEREGYIQDPLSGRRFDHNLLEVTPYKLLNYYIQCLETSYNVLVLKDLLKYLRDRKSKVVLYIYDSITVDFSKEDGKECLEDIEKILNREGKFPVKFKYSKSLVF